MKESNSLMPNTTLPNVHSALPCQKGGGLRKPRILWASLSALVDTSSGAAISVREMLRQLAFNGYEVAVVGATIFDSEQGLSRLPEHWKSLLDTGDYFTVTDDPLLHHLLQTKSTKLSEMTLRESGKWMALYQKMLDSFKPDLLYFYGGMAIELLISDEARQRGIPVAMYLANGSYDGSRWCRDVDLVVTNSEATATYYRRTFAIESAMVGRFVNPSTVIAAQHQRTNLLFVNPSLEKGAAIVIRLAMALEKRRPDILFEVVESRGAWPALVSKVTSMLGEGREQLDNVLVTPNTTDMRPVYGRARLLLAPSLWWESSGRVAVEAMMNGIPALVTDRGGLPEMVGGGGIRIQLPEKFYEKPWNRLPRGEVLEPLVETIIRLHDDEVYYNSFVSKALQVAETLHHIGASTERLMQAFEPLIEMHAGERREDFVPERPHKHHLS